MKCQRCNKNEAVYHAVIMSDAAEKARDLCADCLAVESPESKQMLEPPGKCQYCGAQAASFGPDFLALSVEDQGNLSMCNTCWTEYLNFAEPKMEKIPGTWPKHKQRKALADLWGRADEHMKEYALRQRN
jgi:protein-arginine kinase activator protein McsA